MIYCRNANVETQVLKVLPPHLRVGEILTHQVSRRILNNASTELSQYHRITAQSGEQFFSIFCTSHSLKHKQEQVYLWAHRLAGRLHWGDYNITTVPASKVEATERMYSLFEYRYQID